MEHLPYKDEQFDAVFAANSVQFSGNPVATVREFARVCRPQGRIVAGLFGSPAQVIPLANCFPPSGRLRLTVEPFNC